MLRGSRLLLLAACASLAFGCTDPAKVPSEAALAAADAAFAQVKDETQKLLPAETEALAKEIAEAKAQYAAQKYKEALAAAGAAGERAKALGAAALAKKEELEKAFYDAVGELAPMLGDAKARIEELKKAKKLPKGIDKAAVEKADAALAELSAGLDAAHAKLKAGALQDAAAAAKALPAKAQELIASLGGGETVAAK
ncbi:MAG TPA: hypothetical protein VFL83_09275 [Anaeromyxobacter sp.]|nr:hypothetical protein [Anaeromyxobacter sp.]